ncbi:MAG: hypothetical protein K2X93_10245 [Candidatus Obscuribacterales bacterium]|nr:hypothetical protein [Candidatus Obscuribacterales bacterium]
MEVLKTDKSENKTTCMFDKISAKNNRVVQVLILCILIGLALAMYVGTLEALPLLDEHYIIEFLKAHASSTMDFLTSMIDWPGPESFDTWGILTSGCVSLLSATSTQSFFPIRLFSLLVHIANAFVFFIVGSKVLEPPDNTTRAWSTWVGAAASILFLTYPLAPETVSWLGGLAYELGCFFFLVSIYLYIKGKAERNWTTLGVAWIAFLFAILADNSLWSSGFVIVALELARSFIGAGPPDESKMSKVPDAKEVFEDAVDRLMEETISSHREHSDASQDSAPDTTDSIEKNSDSNAESAKKKEEDDSPAALFDTLVPALPFIVLGVLLSIRALPQAGNQQLPGTMIAGFADWGRAFKHLFLPINQSITEGYARHYAFLYILYAVPAVVAVLALVRNRLFRQNVAFLLAWLIMILVPHLHQVVVDSTLSGSRFAYESLLPVSGLIALLFFSPVYAIAAPVGVKPFAWARLIPVRIIVTVVAIAFVAILLPGNMSRTIHQNAYYKRGAKWLDTIASSARNIEKKARSSFCLIRDVPAAVSVIPKISPFSVIIYDGEKRTPRAIKVPGGPLKDALRLAKEPYRDISVHWSREHNSLIKVDLGLGAPAITRLTALDVRNRLRPGMEFLKTVQFDNTNNCLILDSNADTGPVINFEVFGISPVGDDFVYVDAKINTPQDDDNAHMELYWLTVWEKEFSNKDRFTRCRVIVNDGQFHRYYLPVRSTAWSTNGPLTHLTMGFPASAKVVLKEAGTISPPERIAKLTYQSTETESDSTVINGTSFGSLCHDYPNLKDLGLVSMERKQEDLKFGYDTSMVEGATGCVVEIAQCDKFFDNPNGDELSKNLLKTVKVAGTKGSFKLTRADFKTDGIYAIRVFANDKDGKLLSNASDEFNCLVYTRIKTGS